MFYPSGRQQGKENLLVGEETVWGHGRPAGGSRNYSYLRRKLAPQKGTPHLHPREQSHSPGNRGVRHPQVDTRFSPRRPAPQRAPSVAEEEKVLETRNHSEQMLLFNCRAGWRGGGHLGRWVLADSHSNPSYLGAPGHVPSPLWPQCPRPPNAGGDASLAGVP